SLMLEHDIVEFHCADTRNFNRLGRPWLLRHLENTFEVVQRYFGLPIDVDDVSDFLQRAEDKERINPAREELSDRNLTRENQIKHQAQDRRAHRVDACTLDKAQTTQILHLLEFQFQDLPCCAVQATDLLLRQAKTLYKLNVA